MTKNVPQQPLSTDLAADASEIEAQFPALHLTRSSRFAKRFGRFLLILILLAVPAALFAPWQQSIRGDGAVIARNPLERTQIVPAQLKGLLKEIAPGVDEAAYVEKGQLLFRMVDQNSQLQQQLETKIVNASAEIEIARSALEQNALVIAANEGVLAAKAEEIELLGEARDLILAAGASDVAEARNKLEAAENKLSQSEAKLAFIEADYKRKESLEAKGLETKLKLQENLQKLEEAKAGVKIAQNEIDGATNALLAKEQALAAYREEWNAKITKVRSERDKAESDVAKAKSEAQKLAGDIKQKQNKLLDIQGKAEAQSLQEITAPRSGYIMSLATFEGQAVKAGQVLCTIVPKFENPAVEMLVAGNDAPLIHVGDHVRLQFEGWPAIQFSGWPSVAVGTFGGTVDLVDPSDNGKGKFRVVVIPDPEDQPWPEHPYLRPGVRANGWALLETVPLGYEVWRRMNGFPPALTSSEGEEKTKGAKPPKIKI